jgi:hypothetical protein
MSSRPSNFHPNIFSIGSTRLYVVQPVSLWNGTSSSPSPTAAAAWIFSASHGQTSPSGTPPSVVRSVGQIDARPETRTCQKAARGTRRLDPSAMDSDSRKSVVVVPTAQSQTGKTGKTVPERDIEKKETHVVSLPIILPGLPSAPKNVGLLLSAWLKLTRSEARPSRPAIGLSELTCIACAVFSAVICSSPFAFGSTKRSATFIYEPIRPKKKRSHDQTYRQLGEAAEHHPRKTHL